MELGRRIFYDKTTGNRIVDMGERSGTFVETTIEHDFKTYALLAGRVRDTVGVLELEYGQYAKDFEACNVYRVNPDTKELEFSYPDPGNPDPKPEPIYHKPLSEEVEQLKTDNASLLLQSAELDAKNKQLTADHAALLLQLAEKGVL